MNAPPAPVTVAMLAFPESGASVVYGMYDMFMSAGRDWGLVVNGQPGPQLMQPLLVAREAGTLHLGNGVPLTPHVTLADCPPAAIVCVPEVALPPGTPLGEHFREEIAWLKQRYADGAILATAWPELREVDWAEAAASWRRTLSV